MTNADKIFEELGYEKIYETDERVLYIFKNMREVEIGFNKVSQDFDKSYDTGEFYSYRPITIPELKAIYKKCEELRVD